MFWKFANTIQCLFFTDVPRKPILHSITTINSVQPIQYQAALHYVGRRKQIATTILNQ